MHFLPQISVFIFGLPANVHPPASQCKDQSSFQWWVLLRATEGVSLASPENSKAPSGRFSDRFLRDFSFSRTSLLAGIGIDQPLAYPAGKRSAAIPENRPSENH
jgi:hypothetical protein